MEALNGASAFEAYLLAQSILTDARAALKFSKMAVRDGATDLGRALIDLSVEAGVSVIAGAGSAAEEAKLKEAGAAYIIRHDAQNFVQEVMRLTDGQGVELIVDQVAGPDFAENFDMLADFGDVLITGWTDGDPQNLFETMWAKLDRCPSMQLWTLDRYGSQPDRIPELDQQIRAHLAMGSSSQAETRA